MASDFASELESVARELRRQADGALFRELTDAFRRGVDPVQDKVRESLRGYMPDPYADRLNPDLVLRTSVQTTGREPGVSLVASTRGKNRKLKNLEGGELTAPLFGDREHWFTQRGPHVQPGFFSGPCRDAEPEVAKELEDALERVADIVDGRAAGG